MGGKAVCLDDIFWIVPGNIVAIQLQKQTVAHQEFYTTTSRSVIGHKARHSVGSYIFFVKNVCCVVSLGRSHVRDGLTLYYDIFLFEDGALCLMIFIGHGDTLKA
jgi:hypothetical protein